MWSPTHVQVTVLKARGIIPKGNNGVFVTIGLGKEKYQTSVKERENDEIEWHEKCELKIPSHGNTASIVLTVLTHNFLGVDHFLGCVSIPLQELDFYDRPKNKWHELQDRHGKARTKERGELEVKIGFAVKPGSLTDVSRKDSRRSSLSQLSTVGGSLASISSVDKKSFRRLAKTITRKIKKEKKAPEELPVGQTSGDADPGVISDEDEFAFDDLSHTGSGCSLETATVVSAETESETMPPEPTKYNTLPPSKPPRSITPVHEKFVHRWEQKLQEAKRNKLNKSSERIVVGGEGPALAPVSRLSPEVLRRYDGKTKDDLIELLQTAERNTSKLEREKKELEEYIDNLLLRVMEKAPSILQNPFD